MGFKNNYDPSILLTLVLWISLTCGTALTSQAEVMQPASLEVIGVRNLATTHPTLTGRNINLALIELAPSREDELAVYGFVPNLYHTALTSGQIRNLQYPFDPNDLFEPSYHASMIGGILWGNDPNAHDSPLGDFHYRGIAPEATVDIYSAKWFIKNRILRPYQGSLNADVVNISWGSNLNSLLTLFWQSKFDALAIRENCLVVAAAGNGNQQTGVIDKPASGYNVLSVGATGSLGEYPKSLNYIRPPLPSQSSFGPTDDGRCKPDMIAPGMTLGPNTQDESGYSHDSQSIAYSSYATPHVTGVAALLIDAARQSRQENADDPRVIKALLLNGANKLIGWHKGMCGPYDDEDVPLDYQQGAGMVDAVKSHRQLMAGQYDWDNFDTNLQSNRQLEGWDFNHVKYDGNDPNSERTYYFSKPLQAGTNFTATLCWYHRYNSNIIHTPQRLNFLGLELWSLDDQGSLLERLDYSTSIIDNLQHIYYHCQKTSQVALVVFGADFNQGPGDGVIYALAFSAEQKNWPGDLMAGDFNANGIVGPSDILQFLDTWWRYRDGGIEGVLQHLPEDMNLDGRLDETDWAILQSQWQQQSPWKE
ncbi:MAG: S8 family serine peptidase [Phycisphaerae bacterium]|nr:S8 family serine peptidase [Phycisphaerae bacterium]